MGPLFVMLLTILIYDYDTGTLLESYHETVSMSVKDCTDYGVKVALPRVTKLRETYHNASANVACVEVPAASP